MTAPDGTLPKKGDLFARKYRVERQIGHGGMGAVFEVSRSRDDRRFALKLLRPELAGRASAIRRLLREAKAAGRVRHANVVEVHDFGQEGDSAYIVMDLLAGEVLSKRLEHVGHLKADAACDIAIEVCRALGALHAVGVIHRDLNPSNIVMCPDSDTGAERPVLIDFGIAKLTSIPGEASSDGTLSGTVMGTPQYMAIEQLNCKEADARTDVYALGVILYEMLSGGSPFISTTYEDIALEKRTGTPRPLSEALPSTPKDLVAVVQKAISTNPEDRFASAGEFEAALRLLGSHDGGVRATAYEEGRRTTAPRSAFVPSIPLQVGAGGPAPAWERVAIAIGCAGIAVAVGIGLVVASRGQWNQPRATDSMAGEVPPHTQSVVDPRAEMGGPEVLPVPRTERIASDEFVQLASEPPPNAEPWLQTATEHRGRVIARARLPGAQRPLQHEEPMADGDAPSGVVASNVGSLATGEQLKDRWTGRAVSKSTSTDPRASQSASKSTTNPDGVLPVPTHESEISTKDVLSQAATAFVRGQMPRARALYRQVTEKEPDNAEAWKGLGLVSSRMSQPQETRRAFERYLSLRPMAGDAAVIRERLNHLTDPASSSTEK